MADPQGNLFGFGRTAQLSDEQRRALASDATESLVVAAAGSGKTKLLIERLLWAVSDDTERDVVALTFSERAAAEMQGRAEALALTLPAPLRAAFGRRVTVATIDGYCRGLLLEHPLTAEWPVQRLLPPDDLRAFVRLRLFELLRDEGAADLGLDVQDLPEAVEALIRLLRLRGQVGLDIDLHRHALTERVRAQATAELAAIRSGLAGERGLALPAATASVSTTGAAMAALLAALHKKRLSPEGGLARAALRKLLAQCEGLFEPPQPARAASFAKLTEIAARMLAHYQQWKGEHHAFDFADLAHAALALLAEPRVGDRIVSGIGHLLIDEAQDTNPLQERLLARLGERALIYRVGDPRQAIYGFRDADIGAFLDKRSALPSAACFELTRNHRSLAPVLALANAFWNAVASDFATFAPMAPSRAELGAAPELLIVHKDDDGLPALPHEARFVAQVARAAVRDRQLSDVAVLCRTTAQAQHVHRALLDAGVAAFLRAKRTLASLPIYDDTVSLLGAFDQPDWNEAIYCAMRSGPWGATTGDVLAVHRRAAGLPAVHALALVTLSERGERGKRAFLAMLARPRALPRAQLVGEYLGRVGHAHAMAAFAPILQALGATEGLGLSLDEVTARLAFSSVEEASGHSQGVQVMTIHAAKGLEWHTVILPFAARRFDAGARQPSLLSLPSGAATIVGRWPPDGVTAALTWEMCKRERQEELRLLYVALTRARDRLLIVGGPGRKQVTGAATDQNSLVEILRAMFGFPAPHPGERFADLTTGAGTLSVTAFGAKEFPDLEALRAAPPTPAAERGRANGPPEED